MIEFNKNSIACVSNPDIRISEEITDWDVATVQSFFNNNHIKLKKIIINDPATIIFWDDGTKTVVKCDSEDEFDKEKGILYAALKKLSTKETYNNILRSIESFGDWDEFLSGITYKEV